MPYCIFYLFYGDIGLFLSYNFESLSVVSADVTDNFKRF